MKRIILVFLILISMVSVTFAKGGPEQNNGAPSTSTADSASISGALGIHGDVASNNKSVSVAAPIPGSVQYGPTINYFGQPLPTEGFQPVEQLLMYTQWFTEGALENMLKGFDGAEAEFKMVNEGVAPVEGTKWIKIVIQTTKYEAKNVTMIGMMTARADAKKTTMTEVLAKAALTAMRKGCNVLHLTAQGAARDAFSAGWGIGLATTQANISDSQKTSNVTTGGMGYASAKAGTRDLPWLQGFGLYDPDLVAPVARADAKK